MVGTMKDVVTRCCWMVWSSCSGSQRSTRTIVCPMCRAMATNSSGAA